MSQTTRETESQTAEALKTKVIEHLQQLAQTVGRDMGENPRLPAWHMLGVIWPFVTAALAQRDVVIRRLLADLEAAEQERDAALDEWEKRYNIPPWKSLQRMYQEAYPGRDVVASDVLRWADTFIAARREAAETTLNQKCEMSLSGSPPPVDRVDRQDVKEALANIPEPDTRLNGHIKQGYWLAVEACLSAVRVLPRREGPATTPAALENYRAELQRLANLPMPKSNPNNPEEYPHAHGFRMGVGRALIVLERMLPLPPTSEREEKK